MPGTAGEAAHRSRQSWLRTQCPGGSDQARQAPPSGGLSAGLDRPSLWAPTIGNGSDGEVGLTGEGDMLSGYLRLRVTSGSTAG